MIDFIFSSEKEKHRRIFVPVNSLGPVFAEANNNFFDFRTWHYHLASDIIAAVLACELSSICLTPGIFCVGTRSIRPNEMHHKFIKIDRMTSNWSKSNGQLTRAVSLAFNPCSPALAWWRQCGNYSNAVRQAINIVLTSRLERKKTRTAKAHDHTEPNAHAHTRGIETLMHRIARECE